MNSMLDVYIYYLHLFTQFILGPMNYYCLMIFIKVNICGCTGIKQHGKNIIIIYKKT